MGHHSKKDENIIDTKMKKPVELIPKPRTALFQGGEVDESMAPQIIAACVDKKKCKSWFNVWRRCEGVQGVRVVRYSTAESNPCSGPCYL